MSARSLTRWPAFFLFLGLITVFGIGCRLTGGFDDGGGTGSALTNVNGAVVIPEGLVQQNRGKTGAASVRADTIAGHVPIKGAEVWIKELPDVPHQITGDDGSYSFSGVPAGDYHVVASYTLPGLAKVYKMISDSGVNGNGGIQIPTIPLKLATLIVTGILRDPQGAFLPVGTELVLWGQTFTVGADGRFTTPPLPDEGFTNEEIQFRGNGGLRPFFFTVPFLSALAPITIELSIPSRTEPDQKFPNPYLLSKVAGVNTNKVQPSGQVDLRALVENGDTEAAALYDYLWTVEGGNPVTQDNLQPWLAVWAAPADRGLATITVRVTLKSDTKASATARLPILVGINSPAEAAPVPTAVLTNTPAVQSPVADINVTVGGAVAYKYKLDAEAWSEEISVSQTIQKTGLAEGLHTLLVIGKNSFGKWQAEAGATSFSWTVRTVLPVAVLSNTPANPIASSRTNITVAGTYVVAYKYKLDAGAWSSESLVAVPLALEGLSEGNHTLSVLARDDLNRWQPEGSPTVHTWTVSPITNYSYVKVIGNNGVEGGRLGTPNGVCFDAADNMYVVDTDNYRIQKFDSQGNFVKTWDCRVNGSSGLAGLTKIAVGGNRVYVCSRNGGELSIFSTDGASLGNIKTFNFSGTDYTVESLHTVAADNAGNVYIGGRFNPGNVPLLFSFASGNTTVALAKADSSGSNYIKFAYDGVNDRMLYHDLNWGTSLITMNTLARDGLSAVATSHGTGAGPNGVGGSFVYQFANDKLTRYPYPPSPLVKDWDKLQADRSGGPSFADSYTRDIGIDSQGNLYVTFGYGNNPG